MFQSFGKEFFHLPDLFFCGIPLLIPHDSDSERVVSAQMDHIDGRGGFVNDFGECGKIAVSIFEVIRGILCTGEIKGKTAVSGNVCCHPLRDL